jgi:hypothetical protein
LAWILVVFWGFGVGVFAAKTYKRLGEIYGIKGEKRMKITNSNFLLFTIKCVVMAKC